MHQEDSSSNEWVGASLNKKVTVNFKVSEEDRERLRILAAKARCSQSEFLKKLICNYGEQLVVLERLTKENNEEGDKNR